MNTVQRIAKNTGVLLISQIASYIIGFFFIMYTARYLGAEGFGILSFALAFTGIFGVFSDLGLSTLTVREVSRDKSLATKYLENIAVMKIILAIITFGLIALMINLLGYPEQTIKVVYLVALSIIFNAFSGMFYSIFQAYEKMEYQSGGHILSSALMLSGALFAISQGFSVVGFASIYFIVSAIVWGYSFVVCAWKFVLPKIEVDWGFWKPTIKEALPFGLTGIFITIYYYIDTVMLSLMVPNANEVIGWYNAAYRLVLILLFIPSVYFASVFPVMSRLFKTSEESLKFTFKRSFKYMTMIAIPIGVGTTLLADRIILLIFRSEFALATIALQILVWSTVFIFMSQPFGHLFNSINRVLNVVLNVIVIPKYSYVGASITTVATEFFVLLICLFISLKTSYKLQNRFIFNITSKVSFSSVIMLCFVKYFEGSNLVILIISSAMVYLGVLYIIKCFDKKDIYLFKTLLTSHGD
jgi:O-antigen/teichoic acid export membrane protein